MKKNLLISLDILMVLCLVFIGGDSLSFSINNMTIRLVQFIFPLAFINLIFLRAYSFKKFSYFIPFGVGMFLSMIFGLNIKNSLSYFLWMCYNLFLIVFVVASYIKLVGKAKAEKIIRLSFLIVGGLIVIQTIMLWVFNYDLPFLVHQEHLGIYRPALWFYEPSYLATYLSFWLAYSIYKLLVDLDKKYIFDAIFMTLLMCMTTSSTAFLAVGLIYLCGIIFFLFQKKVAFKIRIGVIGGIVSLGIIAIVMMAIFTPHIFETFFMRIFNDGIFEAGGDRFNHYKESWEMFLNRPIFGVGPNNYNVFLGQPSTYQPTNITLEILSTTGIVGLIGFYFIPGVILYKLFSTKNSYVAIFALIIFLITLQANQNYLRLYLWLFIGISLADVWSSKTVSNIKTVYINGLFLTQPRTGIQRLCFEFVKRIKKYDNDKKYIILAPKTVKEDSIGGIEILKIGFLKGVLWEQIILPIYTIFRPKSILLNLGNQAPILNPSYVMIHDMIFFEKNYNKGSWALKNRILTILNIGRYERIITPSQFTKERILELMPIVDSTQIIVANPSALHMLDIKPQKFEHEFKNYYLSVSSILPNKNFELIVEAAKLDSSKNFVVIGKKEKIENHFSDIPSNVIFTGYITDENLAYLYLNCDGFISPSFYEGFGLTPLEAISLGCKKIFISDIKVYHEVYGECANYFDPNNPKSLLDSIKNGKILDVEQRSELLKKYDWDIFTKKVIVEVLN